MAPANPMHDIHKPVPGMADHGWHRRLANIFSVMDEHTAFYRSNFGIDRDNRNTYYLDERNEFQSKEAVAAEYGEGTTSLAEFRNRDYGGAENAFMSTEFQSMTRLPRTHSLVFTLHKYFAPLAQLSETVEGARAAAMALRVLEDMTEDKLLYTLGESEAWREDLRSYLHAVAAAAEP